MFRLVFLFYNIDFDGILVQNEILNNNESSILYVYDFMNMWTFFIELLSKTSKNKNESHFSLIFSKGDIPKIPPKKKFTHDDKDIFSNDFNIL